MRSFCLLAASLCLIANPLLAQSGDKPGEVQNELPSHIVVPPAPALSVEEALKSFKLAPGFKIEAIASDPLLNDPVVALFGADGRLWVVEMTGFMPNVDGIGEDAPIGTIAILEDTDRDGKMDKRTVFADGLVLPRALLPVADGALVGAPPHLWFMRDTDGDGRADEKIEVASDYGDRTNPEHTANSLFRGLDNWIYSANFTTRYRYEAGKWRQEKTAFRGQWGLTHDDTGRLYFNNNSVPLQADAFPSEYLTRNPALPASQGLNRRLADPEAITLFPGRITPGINRGYRTLGEDLMLRAVTAACGPLIYRGAGFPAEFQGNAFICEPSANLVKRIVVSDTDSVLTATNAYRDFDFLTSTDERFRPVNLTDGPDGGLYIVDLYRGILQHRIYITTYLRKQIEDRQLATPLGLGRIYRVTPTDQTRPAITKYPAQMSASELVETLNHKNGWWRDTAQRLLVERGDKKIAGALRSAATQHSTALGRFHALWTLQGLGELNAATLLAALKDQDERVVALAARLSEPFLSQGNAELLKSVVALTQRPESKLRLQAAFSLGASSNPTARKALFELASVYGSQPYLNEAIVSSLPGRELELLQDLTRHPAAAGKRKDVSPVVSTAAAAIINGRKASDQQQLFAWLAPQATTPPWLRSALLAGIDQSIPKSSRANSRGVSLAAVPTGLIAYSTDKTTPNVEAVRAKKLLDSLQWPGKPEPKTPQPAAVTLNTAELALFEKGRTLYAICAGCHQPDGKGMTGLAPALVNSRWVLGKDEVLARIVLHGKEEAPILMPPLGALDDETIASVLTFVRHSWGHAASAVTPETVAAVRAATKGRDEPWKNEELEALSR